MTINIPVTPKPAFYEWAEKVRRESPYILGTKVWHLDRDRGRPLCNTRPWIRRRGNEDDVTASGIPLCRTCYQLALRKREPLP